MLSYRELPSIFLQRAIIESQKRAPRAPRAPRTSKHLKESGSIWIPNVWKPSKSEKCEQEWYLCLPFRWFCAGFEFVQTCSNCWPFTAAQTGSWTRQSTYKCFSCDLSFFWSTESVLGNTRDGHWALSEIRLRILVMITCTGNVSKKSLHKSIGPNKLTKWRNGTMAFMLQENCTNFVSRKCARREVLRRAQFSSLSLTCSQGSKRDLRRPKEAQGGDPEEARERSRDERRSF